MSQRVIRMPDIGEGVTEAEVVEWNVTPGQVVMEDEPLLSVMTDKASVELPSPVAGTVVSLSAEVGEMVAVGADLVVIEISGAAPAADPVREPRTSGRDVVPAPSPFAPQPAAASAAPGARREPRQPPHPAHKPLASPAVRRRAREMELDLSRVTGSGPRQRITHTDLEAHGHANARAGASPPGTGGEEERITLVKLTGLRRRIAQNMEIASREIPHITYVEEVDVTELQALRAHLNQEHGATRGTLTILPFVALAVIRAVTEFPRMNAHYDSGEQLIRQHRSVHLGVATQTPAGLMVPVLHDAHSLDLWGIADEVGRLASAARDGSATRDQLGGSTITLSSLGALGGLVSTPVINQPEVAIVGVNRIRTAPVLSDGMFVPRQMMNLSSSFDHRIVDGWDAASFIQRIRALLQHPATLFVGG